MARKTKGSLMKKMKKSISKHSLFSVFIMMFLLFAWLSITVWLGFFLIPQWDIFSTKTENIVSYQDESEYSRGNVSYPFTYWMVIKTSSRDGFLVGNEIDIDISGFVEYTGERVPENANITTNIRFIPSPIIDNRYLSEVMLKTKKGDVPIRFEFSYSTDIIYSVSGPKNLQPLLSVDQHGGMGLEEISFIDIEPAHIMTQLKMTKAVVVLTLWVVFLSIFSGISFYKLSKKSTR